MHWHILSSALPNNLNAYYTDMQYLSFQVIKGLSYLREKHKIMHRGQSLFHLLKEVINIIRFCPFYKTFKYMNTRP